MVCRGRGAASKARWGVWRRLQDNYPNMDMTCLDLSPFYLAKARENLQYWRSKRAPGAASTDEFIQVAPSCRPHLSSLSRNKCIVL